MCWWDYWRPLWDTPPQCKKPSPPEHQELKNLQEAFDEHMESLRRVDEAATRNTQDAKRLKRSIDELVSYMERRSHDPPADR